MKLKKLGILTLSTMLGFGTLANGALAVSPSQVEQPDQLIKVSSLDINTIDKSELIKKFKNLFPGKYDFLEDRDFHIHHFHYPELDEEEMNRISLSFHKRLGSNQDMYGHIEFIGENKELQHFYAQPTSTKDAMYPPKVSQEEAKKIATEFINNLKGNKTYRIKEGQGPRFHWRNRTLTEPIEYEFYFEKIVNDVPVENQGLSVVVLGNGDITQFSRGQYLKGALTYESIDNTLNQEEILQTIKDILGVELRYIIQHSSSSTTPKAELVYIPRPQFEGVHAKNGKWLVGQEFVEKAPEPTEIKMLKPTNKPVAKPVTKEEVRKLVESLLPKETSSGKLHIEGVHEEKYNDIEVYSVMYSYRTNSGSSGTSMAVNKQTGEIIHFYDITSGHENVPNVKLSYEEGLNKAIQHLEKFAPHSMGNYAYPRDHHYKTAQRGQYSYHFPLIKNGIVVDGAGFYVSVSAEDGRLLSFNNHPLNIEQWPSTNEVVGEEKALEAFKEWLKVNLSYKNLHGSKNENHFYLVFAPEFKDRFARFDAILGEWTSEINEFSPGEIPKLEGHWAQKEINHLISSKILTVEDPEKFNPNDKVTKGVALEVLVKSIMYVDHYFFDQSERQSFENISKDHSLYPVVERAVDRGIIDANQATFNLDEPITRQELAYWYIKALGLENVAKHSEIYHLPFADRNLIKKEYTGYVAIANALGIFQGNSKNQFLPNEHASLAHLAVTNFRFARQAAEFNIEKY